MPIGGDTWAPGGDLAEQLVIRPVTAADVASVGEIYAYCVDHTTAVTPAEVAPSDEVWRRRTAPLTLAGTGYQRGGWVDLVPTQRDLWHDPA
ncbi:hypothetical protein ACFC09_17625 [Streptomyces sp. NPDC056161]|uniref:hypothetical protein n=1 Tax=Streptomyces sp. NPDC056161 TaxID=3345732 RepID=UPI0035D9E62F